MEDLQVPTRQVLVEVFTTDGGRASGSLYLNESTHQTGGAADVMEVLNDERVFVPFSADNPRAQRGNAATGQKILNKNHIVRVHLDGCSSSDLHHGADDDDMPPPCTLLLADGCRLMGRVLLETPPSLSRLVDKLNRAPRFMPFVSDDGIEFVHAAHVVSVCWS